MIGKRIGRLVVIGLDEERSHNANSTKYYFCQCDCGNIKSISRSALIKPHPTSSCGCLIAEKSKSRYIDLIGQKFGKLLVTRKKENDPNDSIRERRIGAWWYADCDCGTKDVVVKGSYLRVGRIQSCGCYNKETSHDKNMNDLTGQKYGMLTVIEEVKDVRKNGSIVWRCVCECGNETIVSSNALRGGNTISCGCLTSKNEWRIRKYLSELNIKYEKQYSFDDLRSPITNYPLKFDVAVFDIADNLSFLIEYDGEQHKYGIRYSHDPQVNKEKFERTVLYDNIKNEYCASHNIDLLRISFNEKRDIENILNNKLKEKGLI